MGNIAPQISINGPAEYTNASRGKGAFDICMRAMDNLRQAGCVFGFSSLVIRDNVDAICSEEWIDLLIEKGALYGWLFLYMPVGGEILSINRELEKSPGLVNESPYKDGWMIEVRMKDPNELDDLMTTPQYLEMLKGLDK